MTGMPAQDQPPVGSDARDVARDIEACPVCGGEGKFASNRRDLQFDLQEIYTYASCAACGAFYQTPMPDGEKIASFYPSEYDAYDPPGKLKQRSLPERAVLNAWYGYRLPPRNFLTLALGLVLGLFRYRDSVPYCENGRALDVGCGNGKFVRTLGQLGWRAEGLDFSADAVRAANEAGIPVRQGTLTDEAFAPGSFDLVSARHLIEHVPDPTVFVANVRRLLRQGAAFVIRTPNSRALARGFFGANWFPDEVPRHLVLYSPANLDLLLRNAGFERVTVRTFTSPKFILNSWDYRTGNRGKASRKKTLHRMIARIYVLLASLMPGRGDEIFAIYRKTET